MQEQRSDARRRRGDDGEARETRVVDEQIDDRCLAWSYAFSNGNRTAMSTNLCRLAHPDRTSRIVLHHGWPPSPPRRRSSARRSERPCARRIPPGRRAECRPRRTGRAWATRSGPTGRMRVRAAIESERDVYP